VGDGSFAGRWLQIEILGEIFDLSTRFDAEEARMFERLVLRQSASGGGSTLATGLESPSEAGEAKLTPADDDWWPDLHAISLDVRDARKAHRFERAKKKRRGDPEYPDSNDPADVLVAKLFRMCTLEQQKWARNRMVHSGGWVLQAHPMREMGLPEVPPQFRHDVAEPGDKEWSYHPSEIREGYVPLYPAGHSKAGKPIPEPVRGWRTAGQSFPHLLRDKGDEGDHKGIQVARDLGFVSLEPGHLRAELRDLIENPDREADREKITAEVMKKKNWEEPHLQQRKRKYLLTIKPGKPLNHDHADYVREPEAFKDRREKLIGKKGEERGEKAFEAWRKKWRQKQEDELQEHLRDAHDRKPVEGWHVHDGVEHKEILIPDKDPKNDPGKRIDVHPWAAELFATARVVFVVMEGKLKNDAILSFIREHNLPAVVCNVPSVTMWDCFELKAFAKEHLAGKTVFVICDADWYDNPLVDTQALLLRSRLRDYGIDTHVAAPPIEFFRETGEKGADDYLALGHSLMDMEVRDVEIPQGALSDLMRDWLGAGDRRRARRNARALEGLSIHTGDEETIHPSLQGAAQIMGKDRYVRDAKETLEDLAAADVITIERGTLEINTGLFLHDGTYIPGLTWTQPPTVKIAERFRAKVGARRLGAVQIGMQGGGALIDELMLVRKAAGLRQEDVSIQDVVKLLPMTADKVKKAKGDLGKEAEENGDAITLTLRFPSPVMIFEFPGHTITTDVRPYALPYTTENGETHYRLDIKAPPGVRYLLQRYATDPRNGQVRVPDIGVKSAGRRLADSPPQAS
jgi:hypothetical protein